MSSCARKLLRSFKADSRAPYFVWSADVVPRQEGSDDSVQVEVFQNAPVVEAILSFHFRPLDNLADSFRFFVKELSGSFAQSDEPAQRRRGGGVPDTYTLESLDGKYHVRITRTSFSFHRLAPYVTWEDLEDGARMVWGVFTRSYDPEAVTDTSLRYINHIQTGGGDYAEFFTLIPHIPREIDTGFGEYLLRLVLFDPSVPARAEVTQLVTPTDPGEPDPIFVFDIDVSIERTEALAPDDGRLWDDVARLREYKNRIFFSSITQETRELFR